MQNSRFNGLEEFIQVVETGSFTAAAEQLGTSKSYISKSIKALELRFSAVLFQRTTRQLTLTDVGEALYEHCKTLIESLDKAESHIAALQQQALGTLRIALNSTFGVQHMATAIAEFSRLHPQLELDVTSSYRDVDLLGKGYDLTIRYGEKLEDSSLVAKPLGGYTLCLCATPEYFSHHKAPEQLLDLSRHNCLSNMNSMWQFNINNKTEKMKIQGNWQSEDGAAILAATKAGLGLAQLPEFFIHDDLQQGNLIKVEQPWAYYQRMSWAVYPSKRHLSTKVRLFLDFLTEYTQTQLSQEAAFQGDIHT